MIDLNNIEYINDDEELYSILKNLSLTAEEIQENKFLINETYNERKSGTSKDIIPIIIRGTDGLLYKSYIVSQSGLIKKFIDNIKTQDITKINLKISLKDIDDNPNRKATLLFIKNIIQNYDKMIKGLYIYGSPGRGKTFISQALALSLAKKNCTVGFVNTSELVSHLQQNFGTNKIESIVNTLKNVEYLFIDDIGAETISEWFRDGILLSILSSRMNNKMPIFYSSNYSVDELTKIQIASNKKIYYSQDKAKRLIERIKATSKVVKLDGKNYRY